MMRWLCIVTFSLFLIGSVAGCAEEQAPQPAAGPTAAAMPPATTAPPPQPEATAPEPVVAKIFVYQAEGRRDPFVPLSEIRRPLGDVDSEPQTPLQSFELEQYRLLGVIIGKDAPRAMVQAPDGKSYILAKGLKIGKNGGVIIDINSQAILVEEKYYDFSGNVRTNIQEISVPKR